MSGETEMDNGEKELLVYLQIHTTENIHNQSILIWDEILDKSDRLTSRGALYPTREPSIGPYVSLVVLVL